MEKMNQAELVKEAQARDKRFAEEKQKEIDFPKRIAELEKRIEALEKGGKTTKK